MSTTIYTIGHSSRNLAEFLKLLQVYGIELLCDVRIAPGSRKFPQYNMGTLSAALQQFGIRYSHYRDLGGFRKPVGNSPNTGWRNSSFRGYADYMMTEEFRRALDHIMLRAGKCNTVIMCSEALYWRCHRLLIADALTVRGLVVRHILDENNAPIHTLTDFAQVQDGDILVYVKRDDYPKLPGLDK